MAKYSRAVTARKLEKPSSNQFSYFKKTLEEFDKKVEAEEQEKERKEKARSLSRLANRNIDYLKMLRDRTEEKRQKSQKKFLQERLKNMTLKNLIEKSKMFGKNPKMNEIFIEHLSPTRISNRLLNNTNKASRNHLFIKFDTVKDKLYQKKGLEYTFPSSYS